MWTWAHLVHIDQLSNLPAFKYRFPEKKFVRRRSVSWGRMFTTTARVKLVSSNIIYVRDTRFYAPYRQFLLLCHLVISTPTAWSIEKINERCKVSVLPSLLLIPTKYTQITRFQRRHIFCGSREENIHVTICMHPKVSQRFKWVQCCSAERNALWIHCQTVGSGIFRVYHRAEETLVPICDMKTHRIIHQRLCFCTCPGEITTANKPWQSDRTNHDPRQVVWINGCLLFHDIVQYLNAKKKKKRAMTG